MDQRWQIAAFEELGNGELYELLRLRQQVFVVEQACIFQDLDNRDQQAIHMLCWQGTQLLAYQRCLPPGLEFPDSSLGRIIIAPAARGLQLGRELVSRGIDHNLQRWPDADIQIGAQSRLRAFYESLGFASLADEYVEDGIPHIHMIRPRLIPPELIPPKEK